MIKKVLAILIALAVVITFSLPTLTMAQGTTKGKVDALNAAEKKITIDGKEYTMSEEAARVEVAVGDEVEATVEGDEVKSLKK